MSGLSRECAGKKRTLVSRSDYAAAARSSLSVPRATILRASSARRMGGAKRYPSIASYGDDGFRRLNPSYVLG
jgi:hypothetical protein